MISFNRSQRRREDSIWNWPEGSKWPTYFRIRGPFGQGPKKFGLFGTRWSLNFKWASHWPLTWVFQGKTVYDQFQKMQQYITREQNSTVDFDINISINKHRGRNNELLTKLSNQKREKTVSHILVSSSFWKSKCIVAKILFITLAYLTAKFKLKVHSAENQKVAR